MSAGGAVPAPVRPGVDLLSFAYSTPVLIECDSEPVRNSKFRFVWFVKLRLMRSLIWRARVTRPVAGLNAAGFWIAVTTASRWLSL